MWRSSNVSRTQAPDFALTDQNGQPFALSSLRGRPVAIFFGYTHCPDECPLVMAHLARAVAAHGVPRDARVVFVTVDPVHDSPAVLANYVRLFDPAFVGLTGRRATLERVYAAYHVPRQAAAGPAREADSFEHGSTIYYVGRDGTIKGLGNWDDGVDVIAEHFRADQ